MAFLTTWEGCKTKTVISKRWGHLDLRGSELSEMKL